jgi:hypothetical protein
MYLSYEREALEKINKGFIDVVDTPDGRTIPKTMADIYALRYVSRGHKGLFPRDYDGLLEFAGKYGLGLSSSTIDI